MVRQGLFGEEDCLYLNIYTPALNKDARKASMVFIHPGGFNGGSGDDDMFGPDLIIDEDVILVTLNFRLGALGKKILQIFRDNHSIRKFNYFYHLNH